MHVPTKSTVRITRSASLHPGLHTWYIHIRTYLGRYLGSITPWPQPTIHLRLHRPLQSIVQRASLLDTHLPRHRQVLLCSTNTRYSLLPVLASYLPHSEAALAETDNLHLLSRRIFNVSTTQVFGITFYSQFSSVHTLSLFFFCLFCTTVIARWRHTIASCPFSFAVAHLFAPLDFARLDLVELP